MNNYYDPSQNGFNGNFYQPEPTNFYQTPANNPNLFRNINPNIIQPIATKSPSLLRSLFGNSSRGLANTLSATGSINTATNVAQATTKSFSFTNLLNGASKTLGVINQAIPVIYQVKPIWNNAKTMLRVMKAVNQNESNTQYNQNNLNINNINETNTNDNNSKITQPKNNAPTFFA